MLYCKCCGQPVVILMHGLCEDCRRGTSEREEPKNDAPTIIGGGVGPTYIADLTARKEAYLAALNAERKKTALLNAEADWLAEQLVGQELNRSSSKRWQGAPDEYGECYILYESRQEAAESWRAYARKAIQP